MTPRWVGDYLVCDEIGAGGMARVYVGRARGDFGFRRTVAIKTIHEPYAGDPQFVAQFVDEARLASRIHHPNVVGIIDVIAENRSVVLVLDYVHGETLASLMARAAEQGVAIPIDVAVATVRDLLRGLHAAHEATAADGTPLGIVHRDVSPQNVIVGADGSARLFDFGVAKAVGRLQTTREGAVKGKLRYMAPEQLKNEPVDRRADIFAASVILWELLAGRRLFVGDNDGQVLANVLVGEIDPPSRIRDAIPPALDDVVMRGLARQKEKRFPTAEAMVAALDGAVDRADPETVAAVVKSLAAESLERRAALVKTAEQCEAPATAALAAPTDTVTVASAGMPTIDVVVERSRGRWLAATFVAATAIAALVVFRGGRAPAGSNETPPPTAAATTPSSSSPPVLPPPETSAVARAVESAPALVGSASPRAAAGARAPATPRHASPPPPRAATSAKPCSFVTTDDAGIRRYNRDCL